MHFEVCDIGVTHFGLTQDALVRVARLNTLLLNLCRLYAILDTLTLLIIPVAINPVIIYL